MKISYNWLKEYVDLTVSAEELAQGLTMSGSEVDSIEDADGDKILEMEITSNRPDCLNMIGMAREASTVFELPFKMPEINLGDGFKPSRNNEVECVIENKGLCPKYTARIIENVTIKESSKRISRYLSALGLRPINNVVDITNFCLLELGQPMHAFDMDKIAGDKIIVREAKKGEKVVTIDDIERKLDAGMLVIADESGPVAIAGVMGGKRTEVTDLTRNVLLESAYFDPMSIRRTARKLTLSTDSSYRFERGVDKKMVTAASFRALNMIIDETSGTIGGFYEAGDLVVPDTVIEYDIEKAGKILGVELDRDWVKKALLNLGLPSVENVTSVISVTVPSFREDIKTEIDLTEEVARIYGYDNIPPTLPAITPKAIRKEKARKVLEKTGQILAALGLNEIKTYSLVSEISASEFRWFDKKRVTLKNPLSEEQKVLTPQLIDGMMRSISWNINRGNKDLTLFEIGKVYECAKPGGGYAERPVLCVGMTGLARNDWVDKKREICFFDLKGVIETVLKRLKVMADFHPESMEEISPCMNLKVKGGKDLLGVAGRVTKKKLKVYDMIQDVYIGHIYLDKLIDAADLEKQYKPVPKFPHSTRDISMLCNSDVISGNIPDIIKKEGGNLVKNSCLIDLYEGDKIPEGKRSLTYKIQYGANDRTLTDEEITFAHTSIKKALTKKLGVEFR